MGGRRCTARNRESIRAGTWDTCERWRCRRPCWPSLPRPRVAEVACVVTCSNRGGRPDKVVQSVTPIGRLFHDIHEAPPSIRVVDLACPIVAVVALPDLEAAFGSCNVAPLSGLEVTCHETLV